MVNLGTGIIPVTKNISVKSEWGMSLDKSSPEVHVSSRPSLNKNKVFRVGIVGAVLLAVFICGVFAGQWLQKRNVRNETQKNIAQNSPDPANYSLEILGQKIEYTSDINTNQENIKKFFSGVTKQQLDQASVNEVITVYNLSVNYDNKEVKKLSVATLKSKANQLDDQQKQILNANGLKL